MSNYNSKTPEIMKKGFYYLFLGATCLTLSGCIGKFEEYNTNPYQPTKVAATDLLATMFHVYASPNQNDCQFNNCMWGCFSGHVAAPAQWEFGENTFLYYNAQNKHNDGSWSNYYGRIYPNFYRIQEVTEGRGVVYSIAMITRIYAMHIMLSLQGPIPYTQMISGNTKAAYDSEEVAWKALFEDLDKAIIDLENNKTQVNSDLAGVDQFFKGDLTKWLKFANTLKLRMAIRVSDVYPEAQALAEAAVKSGVMESKDDSAFDTTSGGIQKNGYSIVDAWGEVKANANVISYMNGYNDPRLPKYFTQQKVNEDNPVKYLGVRFGPSQTPTPADYANYSRLVIATDDQKPQPVMYAAEAAFLRAEGALKGWNMGGDAKEFYEKGIRLSFEEFGVSGADAYIENKTLAPAPYQDFGHGGNDFPSLSDVKIKWDEGGSERNLERVLVQKWIALYLDPLNGWSDFRRTGFPKLAMSTKVAGGSPVSIVRGQRRLRFPESEYNNNTQNVLDAVKMLNGGVDDAAHDLWWAKKD